MKRNSEKIAKARFIIILNLVNDLPEDRILSLCYYASQEAFEKWVKTHGGHVYDKDGNEK